MPHFLPATILASGPVIDKTARGLLDASIAIARKGGE
jgi:hypothetical protein